MTPAGIFPKFVGTDWVGTPSNHHEGKFGPFADAGGPDPNS